MLPGGWLTFAPTACKGIDRILLQGPSIPKAGSGLWAQGQQLILEDRLGKRLGQSLGRWKQVQTTRSSRMRRASNNAFQRLQPSSFSLWKALVPHAPLSTHQGASYFLKIAQHLSTNAFMRILWAQRLVQELLATCKQDQGVAPTS